MWTSEMKTLVRRWCSLMRLIVTVCEGKRKESQVAGSLICDCDGGRFVAGIPGAVVQSWAKGAGTLTLSIGAHQANGVFRLP